MTTYGKYTLTEGQVKFIRDEMSRACEGIDIELALDCSGSMHNPVDAGEPGTRFQFGKSLLSALAQPVMAIDDNIGIWSIKEQGNSVFRKPSFFKDNLKSAEAVRAHLDGLTCGGGTPFREILELALNRYIDRLRENPNTKAFNLIIAGDGHDGQIADIVQNAAGKIWDITQDDPRKRLGIQFVLVTTNQDVVDDFKAFDDIPAYSYNGNTLEADVVDVTTFTQIREMGGINSLLCQAKILAGALSEPLDNMLTDLEKTN